MAPTILALWDAHKKRPMVLGHSAGGHLAACMAATDWHTLSTHAPANLVPFAYSISGVFDLAPLVNVSQNADLRLDADSGLTQTEFDHRAKLRPGPTPTAQNGTPDISSSART